MPYKVAAGRTLFASKNYQAKVLDMFGSSIVAYWPQNEAGGTVSRDIGGRNLNGAYTGVTLRAQGIGDGETAASYDGSTSYNNIYSAGLASAFNGQEGTLLAWARVSGAGVWSDGASRTIIDVTVDGSNLLAIRKHTVANNLRATYIAGGTTKDIVQAVSPVTTYFFCTGYTWSKSQNASVLYFGGLSIGNASSLGTWVGTPISTGCVIGSVNTGPTNVWSGTIGPVLLLNRAATAGEIAAASTL